jgi:hypothetical protein
MYIHGYTYNWFAVVQSVMHPIIWEILAGRVRESQG